MSADLSILHLILNATFPVQAVMLLLALASIASWTIILQRYMFYRAAERNAREFEQLFWSGVDLDTLFAEVHEEEQGSAAIFRAGFGEFRRLQTGGGTDFGGVMAGVERAMRVTGTAEDERLEARLSFLATVGSTSPYIGLLGTVWGIMNSFRGLASMQQATLAAVAPGIAEALVATAMGLFAAIPAVIAYNRYAAWMEALSSRYTGFADELAVILHRRTHAEESS